MSYYVTIEAPELDSTMKVGFFKTLERAKEECEGHLDEEDSMHWKECEGGSFKGYSLWRNQKVESLPNNYNYFLIEPIEYND